jgi:hypothetical protein
MIIQLHEQFACMNTPTLRQSEIEHPVVVDVAFDVVEAGRVIGGDVQVDGGYKLQLKTYRKCCF